MSRSKVWRALVDHIEAFGGIPLVAVFDRPKTVALRWGRDGVVTEWMRRLSAWRWTSGSGSKCAGRTGRNRKNLVGWVKGSFFKQRRFLDRTDLEQQLRDWLTETNATRSGAPGRG